MEAEPQSGLVLSCQEHICQHSWKPYSPEKTSAEEERWNIYDELVHYMWEVDRRCTQTLEQWKENKGRLHRLSPLVRKFLSSPPCTVPERVFREIGNISDSQQDMATGVYTDTLPQLRGEALKLEKAKEKKSKELSTENTIYQYIYSFYVISICNT